LNDPRKTSKGNIKYSLEVLILMILLAVVSSFQTYELSDAFGEIKLNWFRQLYPYKYGIPSHDTSGLGFVNFKSIFFMLLFNMILISIQHCVSLV
jgi:hypothetical protein